MQQNREIILHDHQLLVAYRLCRQPAPDQATTCSTVGCRSQTMIALPPSAK
jgi:hypothetical protein